MKSLREGRRNIADSYAGEKGGELWLYNAYIPEYLQANRFNHETRRPRKLLLHKREISRLIGAVEREGMTVVPLKIYFNDRGRAKVELALARGKKLHDKRETEKKRDWDAREGAAAAGQGVGGRLNFLSTRSARSRKARPTIRRCRWSRRRSATTASMPLHQLRGRPRSRRRVAAPGHGLGRLQLSMPHKVA